MSEEKMKNKNNKNNNIYKQVGFEVLCNTFIENSSPIIYFIKEMINKFSMKSMKILKISQKRQI
jgi:hypothetical protein